MSSTIIAAVVTAAGTIVAALVGAFLSNRRKMRVEVDLIETHRSRTASKLPVSKQVVSQPLGKLSEPSAPIAPPLREIGFMTDEYVINLVTELEMNSEDGDELRLVDRSGGHGR